MNDGAAATAHPDTWHIPARTTRTVLALCWLAILFEGYDVGVMGAVLPALAEYKSWSLTPLQLGALGSYALIGMFFGGMGIGTLGDLVGRRRMLLFCVTLFSLSMAGAAWAPQPGWFALFRLIGGLGLGGVIPVAAALTIEYSPPARRSLNYGLMYSGYSAGILCSALVALSVMSHWGWRAVLAAGVVPLLLVPVMARWLPESLDYLVARGRLDDARRLARRLGMADEAVARIGAAQPLNAGAAAEPATWRSVLATLFHRRYLRATVCFWVALFCGMLLVYGLNTWLPQIMRRNGYNLGSSLSFLVVFSLASGIGGIALGRLADRFGPRRIVVLFFAAGALAIYGLMFKHSLAFNYVLVALAGIGSISTSLILTGYLTHYYSAHARGAATGWALSFARFGAVAGPLLGGWVGSMGLGVGWNFIVFSLAGVVAAVMVAMIPAVPRADRAMEALATAA